jgi:hypothetical protein
MVSEMENMALVIHFCQCSDYDITLTQLRSRHKITRTAKCLSVSHQLQYLRVYKPHFFFFYKNFTLQNLGVAYARN